MEQKRLFISYCHKDDAYKRELEAHLSPLLIMDKIRSWNDRQLKVGGSIFSEIGRQITESDVILMLISSDYLASPNCLDELHSAMSLSREGKAVAVPVILRPCAWRSLDFGSILATPKDGHPVSLAGDRDSAWLNVVEDLQELLRGWVPTPPSAKDVSTPAEAASEIKGQSFQPVRKRADHDEIWERTKADLFERLIVEAEDKILTPLSYNIRRWGDDILIDVSHSGFSTYKRAIIADLTYTGIPGYQLEVSPANNQGLAIGTDQFRWMTRLGDGSELFVGNIEAVPLTVVQVAARIIQQIAGGSSWGKGRSTMGKP